MTGATPSALLLVTVLRQVGGPPERACEPGPDSSDSVMVLATEPSYLLPEIMDEVRNLRIARSETCLLAEVVNGNLFEWAGGTQNRLRRLFGFFDERLLEVESESLTAGAEILGSVNRFLLVSSEPVSDLLELQFALFESGQPAAARSPDAALAPLRVPVEPTRSTSVILDPREEVRRGELHNALARIFPESNASPSPLIRVDGVRMAMRDSVVVAVGDTVVVDGLGSTDPDSPRSRLRFRWLQGPPEGSGEVEPENDLGVPAVTDTFSTVAIALPRDTIFVLSLRVDDGAALSDSMSILSIRGVTRPRLSGELPPQTVRAAAARSGVTPRVPRDSVTHLGNLRLLDPRSGADDSSATDRVCVLVSVAVGAPPTPDCRSWTDSAFTVGPIEVAPNLPCQEGRDSLCIRVRYVGLTSSPELVRARLTTSTGEVWVERGPIRGNPVPFLVTVETRRAAALRMSLVTWFPKSADSVARGADPEREVEWAGEASAVLSLWRGLSAGAGITVTGDGLEGPYWEVTVPVRGLERLGVRSSPFGRSVALVAEVGLVDGLGHLGLELPTRGLPRLKAGVDLRSLLSFL